MPAPPPAPPALAVVAAFTAFLDAVFASSQHAARLARAETVADVHVVDADGFCARLVLDRTRPGYECGSRETEAEVQLRLPAAVLHAVLSRRAYLPLEIVRGAAVSTGPVRKLLAVLPIMLTRSDVYAAALPTFAAQPVNGGSWTPEC